MAGPLRSTLLLVLLAVGAASCRTPGSAAQAGASSGRPGPGPGIHEQTLDLPGGQTLRFTLSIPDEYRGDQPFPLIVALHYGGRVTPYYGRGMLEILVQPALAELGAIIVAPDALDRGWDDDLDEGAVMALMDHLTSTLAIDRKRVLCTGYSMGGVGTWYLAGRHPDRFSAAIPVAGRPVVGLDLKVPVFAIHGRQDAVMPLSPTEAEIARLKAAGSPAELLVIEDVTHYQTDRFVEPMRVAVLWMQRIWADRRKM
jgi:predicted peptidase